MDTAALPRFARPRLALLAFVVAALTGTSCKFGKETTVAEYDTRWDAMSFGDKMIYMQDVVTPAMRDAFVGFDAERFADFDCETCHGPGVDDGTYALPNPQLPRLQHKGFFKQARKDHPDMVRFMYRGVEVPLGKMLGMSYGPKGELACGTCHLVDE